MLKLSILSIFSLLLGVGYTLSGKFIYVSDIHYDPILDCDKYNQTTYCRDPAFNLGVPEEVQQYYRRLAGFSSTDSSIVISAPLSAGNHFGRYGCDSTYDLMDAAFRNAAKEVPNPDFILYGGDVAAHELNETMVNLSWETMHAVILRYFGSSVPVYVTIGNNDLPVHYHANCASPELSSLSSLLASWNWLDSNQQGTFAQMGAYSQLVPGTKLRIISLNTNSLYRRPSYSPASQGPSDCGQLDWLYKELASAGESGENVILLGHVPAGTDSFNGVPLWNETYLSVFQKYVEMYMEKYPDMIVYTTFGHVHKSEFRIMGKFDDDVNNDVNSDVTPYNGISVIGAISPVYSNNPTYRIMTYNKDSTPHVMKDYEDHFMDLRASVRENKEFWYKDYEFTKAYEMDGVGPKNIVELVKSAKKSSVRLSDIMARSTSHYYSQEQSIVCIMTTNNKKEYDECVNAYLG